MQERKWLKKVSLVTVIELNHIQVIIMLILYTIEIGAYRKLSMFEEIEIRKQKKLTVFTTTCSMLVSLIAPCLLQPAQMDDLITMLDEELNYSQKVSRKRINALIKENSAERRKNMVDTSTEKAWQFPPVSLDMSALEREFLDGEEEKKMIVHEQLTSMERYICKPSIT